MKIFKYEIVKEPNQYGDLELEMPKEAVILAVQTQKTVLGEMLGALGSEAPCIWALVNEEAPTEVRRFRLIGTGQDLPDGIIRVRGVPIPNGYIKAPLVLDYIGTFQEGPFVWHLWERGSK